MSRLVSATKKIVELYLIIVGGAYTLTALVALIANAHYLLTSEDRKEIQELHSNIGDNWIMLAVAGLILTAGVGVKMSRWWGLLLAGVMGIAMIGYAVTQSRMDPWEYHNFTIAMPMAAILLWAMLPATWQEFKRRSFKAS